MDFLVKDALQLAFNNVKINSPINRLQKLVCTFFKEKGHPTILDNPGTTKGFVHSLGHGVGVSVHEAPPITSNLDNNFVFRKGTTVSIYYECSPLFK